MRLCQTLSAVVGSALGFFEIQHALSEAPTCMPHVAAAEDGSTMAGTAQLFGCAREFVNMAEQPYTGRRMRATVACICRSRIRIPGWG